MTEEIAKGSSSTLIRECERFQAHAEEERKLMQGLSWCHLCGDNQCKACRAGDDEKLMEMRKRRGRFIF